MTDIQYWQGDTPTITVEPKTDQGRREVAQAFPPSEAGEYSAYIHGETGNPRWEFDYQSDKLAYFLANTECSSQKQG